MNDLSGFLGSAKGIFMDDVIGNLKSYAVGLFITLATIDLALSTLKNLGDPDTFKKLCFNILKYGGVYYVLTNFPYLAGRVFESCVTIGGIAAQGKPLDIGTVNSYPGDIINQGLNCFLDHFSNITNFLPDVHFSLNIFSLGASIIKGILTWPMKLLLCIIIAFLILICFGVLAIEIFMILIEFYICVGVSVMFVPFAACRQTSFLFQKAVNVIIGFGIKVIFAVLVVTVAKEQLRTMVTHSGGHIEDLINILFTVSGFAILAWQVPKIAMGFLGGSPSQGASGVIGSAMRAGGAVVGVAAGAAKAAGGLYQAAKTGAAGASAGGGGGISAASKVGGGGSSRNGGSVGSAASSVGTGEGEGNSPSSLAPQKSGSKTQNSDVTSTSKGSRTQNSDATGSSVETASKRSKLSGALKGMGQYIASNTSFGKGMADAEYKAEMRDRMKNRLKGGGGGTANSTNPNRVSNEIRRRNEDDDD
jgi:type IV secretion system protein TrbL